MLKGRHFDRSVILLCARLYLAYGLSSRNLEEMVAGALSRESVTLRTEDTLMSATRHLVPIVSGADGPFDDWWEIPRSRRGATRQRL
jgi:transposase-like protein